MGGKKLTAAQRELEAAAKAYDAAHARMVAARDRLDAAIAAKKAGGRLDQGGE
jgi:hypothetical protein